MAALPAAAVSCPACAAPVTPETEVCPGCGAALFTPQRRIVTVLFTDLVGYTTLCSEVDHEEVHLLVRPLMNGLRRVCEDLGGHVPAIEGDGFMSVFGALTADPDDPQRAVIAAARMQRLVRDRRHAFGGRLGGLRVGVHVGELLVAPSWEQHGFSVSGDVVNVASRLCAAGDPDEVLVSAEAKALTNGLEWTRDRVLHVRNRADEVAVSSLSWSADAEPSAAIVRARAAALVGRDAELRELRDLGSADLLVVGESGVGKTRLVDEWLDDTGHEVGWLRCSSFEVDSERGLLLDLLATLNGVDETLRAAAAELAANGPLDELVADVSSAIREAAQLRPTTVVIDDAQWASEAVRGLVSLLQGGPRLVLVSRVVPDWVPVLPAVTVGPLGPSSAGALVDALLPGCPAAVHELLAARSGGLPLFLEQCAEMLLAEGTLVYVDGECRLVDEAGLRRIPTAMRLFVSARLDLLRERERRVLLAAAVLGDRVDRRLLSALHPDADAAVEELLERGLVRVHGESLAFAHDLVRDVAYASQLRRTRRDIHCAAADWYGILPAREMLEARARHLLAAVNVMEPPDCQLALDAVLALTTWAQSIVDERPAVAVSVVEDVIRLAEALPQCDLPLLDAHLVAAQCYAVVGREHDAARHARLAAPLVEERGDLAGRAEVALLQGRGLLVSDPAGADASLREAIRLYLEAGDRAGAARAEVERAGLGQAAEGLTPSVRAHEEAYRVGIQMADKRLVATSAQQLAFLTSLQSRRVSEQWVERAAAATRSDDERGVATVRSAEAFLLVTTMEPVRGSAVAEQAMTAAAAIGADFAYRNAVAMAVDCELMLGRLDRAGELLDELDEVAGRRPNPRWNQTALGYRAVLLALRGRPDEARQALAAARASEGADDPAFACFHSFNEGLVSLRRGDFPAAAAAAADALALDQQLDQPLSALNTRLLALRADVASRSRVSLAEGLSLPREAAERGAHAVSAVARQWLRLDDVLRGEIDTELPQELPDLPESRALHLETTSLRERRPELLLEAAREWSTLGATIWPARALTWHTALTGEEHPEVEAIVASVGADPAVIDFFAGQVS